MLLGRPCAVVVLTRSWDIAGEMSNLTVWKFDSPGGAVSAGARVDTLAREGRESPMPPPSSGRTIKPSRRRRSCLAGSPRARWGGRSGVQRSTCCCPAMNRRTARARSRRRCAASDSTLPRCPVFDERSRKEARCSFSLQSPETAIGWSKRSAGPHAHPPDLLRSPCGRGAAAAGGLHRREVNRPMAATSTSTATFRALRDLLLEHREDYAQAYEGFRWPRSATSTGRSTSST